MIFVAAPAKLNLYLHITGKRQDGYHLLESLVAFTEFGDKVECELAETLSLEVIGPFAHLLENQEDDNIVMKAARRLQSYAKGKGARIVLHKHIPVGAGLGGGSSDAAAAIRGLIQLWGLSLDKNAIMGIALELGSDAPVCLGARSARISGIGEQVVACDITAKTWVLLVNPGIPLLTAEVYRRWSGAFDAPCTLPASMHSFGALVREIGEKRNTLEASAKALLPVIGEIITRIRETPECSVARMSGSGATCFGLYEKEAQAHKAAEIMAMHYPQGWHKVTKLI